MTHQIGWTPDAEWGETVFFWTRMRPEEIPLHDAPPPLPREGEEFSVQEVCSRLGGGGKETCWSAEKYGPGGWGPRYVRTLVRVS